MLLRHCRTFHVAWLLFLHAWPTGVAYAEARAGTGPDIVIERRLAHYVVERSGAYRLTVDDVRRIAGPRAFREDGQYTIAYDKSLEEVVSIDAYAQKPDGRRVPVRPDAIEDRQESPMSGAPAADGVHLKIVVFPDLASGDRIVVRYAIRRNKPLFAGHFEELVTAPPHRVASLEVVYDMPAGMLLHADAAGFAPVPDAHSPGRLRYRWRQVDGTQARIEAGAVGSTDAGRRLAVSTFAGYPGFAAALRQAAAGRAAPTPAIAALARQVAAGLPDAHRRALALSGWVGRHVRHAGNGAATAGMAPHSAPAVLANGYGDCKDHAVLLQALLAAAGIDSTPALVNNGNIYTLPDAPTLGVFNHMIVHVPALDLYLDPTSGDGTLPPGVLGKPVLLLNTGTFAMTPLLQPRRAVTAATVDVEVEVKVEAGRRTSSIVAVARDGKSAVDAAVRRMTLEQDRRQDYVCPAIDAEDDTGFRLPNGVRLVALPRAVHLMDGGIAYSASYTRERSGKSGKSGTSGITEKSGASGDTILVRRRLTFRHGRPTCSPADWRAMQPALARIQRDLRSRIVIAGR